MSDFYFLKCIDFDSIAQNAYTQYLGFSKEYEALGNGLDVLEVPQAGVSYIAAYKNMESAAYMAVVFEALAIEAYVNTLGEHLIGERYYQEYESKDAKKDRTTLGKLKRLCENEIRKSYPTDGVHYREVKGLLKNVIRLYTRNLCALQYPSATLITPIRQQISRTSLRRSADKLVSFLRTSSGTWRAIVSLMPTCVSCSGIIC